MIRTSKKLFTLILCAAITLAALPNSLASAARTDAMTGEAMTSMNVENGEKENTPGEIIVGLKEPYLGLNPEELFPELDILEIEDWYKPAYESNKGNPDADKDELEDLQEKIGTVFVITLNYDKAWDIIEPLINENPYVSYAQPNTFDEFPNSPAEEPRSYENDFEPGVVLVGFKDGHYGTSLKQLFPELGILEIVDLQEALYEQNKDNPKANRKKLENLRKKIGKDLVVKLSSETKEAVLEAVELLEQHPYIAYAQPSYLAESEAFPNDPFFTDGAQWELHKIHAPEAWDITTGSSSVQVGVLDTGIYPHPDLEDNLDLSLAFDAEWAEYWAEYLQFGNNDEYYDSCFDGPSTMDTIGHGTAVAEIIGAVGNNGIEGTGVCWDVSMIPIRINRHVYFGLPHSSLQALGIEYADLYDIPILNMSHSIIDSTLIVEALSRYDGLFIKSAGNESRNRDDDSIFIELQELGNVIFVAATDQNDSLATFSDGVTTSDYGVNTVALGAPGINGTSYAAPHVAGAAALLKSKYPDATTAQIKDALLKSVDRVPALNGLVSTGGRLNAYRALQALDDMMSGGVSSTEINDIWLEDSNGITYVYWDFTADVDVTFSVYITSLSGNSNYKYSGEVSAEYTTSGYPLGPSGLGYDVEVVMWDYWGFRVLDTAEISTSGPSPTDYDRPTSPDNLEFGVISSNDYADTMYLSWDAADDNVAVAGYIVRISYFQPKDGRPPTSYLFYTQSTDRIFPLPRYCCYSIRIYAVDTSGNWSESIGSSYNYN